MQNTHYPYWNYFVIGEGNDSISDASSNSSLSLRPDNSSDDEEESNNHVVTGNTHLYTSTHFKFKWN